MALIFIPALGASLAGFMRFLIPVLCTALGAVLLSQLVPFTLATLGLPADVLSFIPVIAGLIGAGAGLFIGVRLGRTAFMQLNEERPVISDSQSLAADAEINPDEMTGFTGFYLRVLRAALRLPSLVILLAVATLVLVQVGYGIFGKGVEFFPDVEPENAILQVHGRGNLSIDERDALLRQVEDRVLALQRERGEFHTIFAKSMATSGNRDDEAEDLIGVIQLELTDWFSRRPADAIIADIRKRTAPLAGILVEPRKEESGPPVGKAVQVQISSIDPELIEPVAQKIAEGMVELGDFVDIEDGRPVPGIEWELSVDRSQAAKFGADVTLIGSYVRMITYGTKLGEFRPHDSREEIDIVVRLPKRYRNIDHLDQIRIQTTSGLTPISNFVTRAAKPKVGLLRRTDGNRVMTVKADVAPGVLADTKVTEIRQWLKTADIDPRTEITFKGEDEEQKQAQEFLIKAFVIALFLMAIILVTQFNSFYSAFLILTAVIMSTIGVMLGLLITGQPFGIVMSGIGVIALAGIVVNNNIVLIDTFDRFRETGVPPLEAIMHTGAQRLRPVLLTTVTTILGLMPMVLAMNIDFGSRLVQIGAPSTQWWTQLSSAIVFGLSFATVLTLFFTPCALMLRENLRTRQAAKSSTAAADSGPGSLPRLPGLSGPGKNDVPEELPAVAE
jgi:multidrug efflux pump